MNGCAQVRNKGFGRVAGDGLFAFACRFLQQPAIAEDITQRERRFAAVGTLRHELHGAVVPVLKTPCLDLEIEQPDGGRRVIRIQRQRLPGRCFRPPKRFGPAAAVVAVVVVARREPAHASA